MLIDVLFYMDRSEKKEHQTSWTHVAAMDAEMPNLGSSLPVPSVKELVKQPMTKVPERYVVPNQDSPVVPYTTSLPQVPVTDLSKLLSEDATELEKLDLACKEWGFFQVWLIFLLYVFH
ncbi:Thebaine 6-O-demethylase [Spatholobus suberectus]|nr:Thebaine 6-O-demethylase [Spatholobus suberectus]